jgi:transcriptional regulator with XRE-family HTH domain
MPVFDLAAIFGDNLARERRRAGFSQDELSARASVHRTEISQVERGLRIPRLDTVARLCGSLEVSPERLFEGIEWQPGGLRRGGFRVPSEVGEP